MRQFRWERTTETAFRAYERSGRGREIYMKSVFFLSSQDSKLNAPETRKLRVRSTLHCNDSPQPAETLVSNRNTPAKKLAPDTIFRQENGVRRQFPLHLQV